MIGVVIPYNGKFKLLNECLLTLSQQRGVELAVVLVYDGISFGPKVQNSSFHSLVKLRTRYQNNQVARNTGATFLRNSLLGEDDCILFCDCDVAWYPDSLQKMEACLKDAPRNIGYVYCDYNRRGHLSEDWIAGEFSPERLREDNFISTMSLIRMSALPPDPVWDPDIRRMQDWALWLKMLQSGLEGFYYAEELFSAYYDADSISLRGYGHCQKWKKVVRSRYCQPFGVGR